jgi:PAS domain S-box-containing protein
MNPNLKSPKRKVGTAKTHVDGRAYPGIFWVAACLFLLWGGLFSKAAEVPLDSEQTQVVGCELSFPPFSVIGPQQEPGGFTVELWQAVAKEAGIKYKIKVAPFHEILQDFKEERVDVMINLAQSAERKTFTSFAVPHVTMYGTIFVRNNEKTIKSNKDLPGRSLIVLNRDLAHDYAINQGWKQLILVDSVEEGLRMLAAGKGDAMLVGKLVGLSELRDHKIKGVKVLPEQLEFYQNFAFGVKSSRLGSAELLARINDGLAAVKVKGEYDKLYEKWFGVLESNRTPSLQTVLKYLLPAIILLLLISGAYLFERKVSLKLRKSLSTLNATLEATADGIMVMDLEGRFTLWNKNFSEIFELSDAFIASSPREVVIDKISALLQGKSQLLGMPGAVAKDEDNRRELLMLKDGRAFEWHSRQQLLDGKLIGRVWSFRDVSDRERALNKSREFSRELEERVQSRTRELESLSLSLKRLSYVASRTSNAVIITDSKGKIEWVNRGFEAVTGFESNEVIGLTLKEFLKDRGLELNVMEQVADAVADARELHFELSSTRKNGTSYFLNGELCPVFDESSEPVNCILIGVDITSRRLTEQKLLEQKAELSTLNVNLELALRSRDEFLASMSHELRTPLNAILTFSELVGDSSYGQLTPKQSKCLSQISESGQQLLALINDILELAELDAGINEIKCASYSVSLLCEAALRSAQKPIKKKRQKVDFKMDMDDDIKIWVDFRCLRQVIVNLLDNASKFSADFSSIEITCSRNNQSVSIKVRDNGIGIPAERLANIFDPFVQLDSGLARKYGGTGLGLAVVKKIVDLHNGMISVESEIGKGSVFTVCLPVNREEAIVSVPSHSSIAVV